MHVAGTHLAIILYGDGVTIANPIGVFRNNSKVDIFYWGLINIGTPYAHPPPTPLHPSTPAPLHPLHPSTGT